MDNSLTRLSEWCNRQQQQLQRQPNIIPSMACFPGCGTDTSLLLQESLESESSPGLLPAIYNPLSGMDSSSLCICSPCTDSSHDNSHSNGPLAVYNPSMLDSSHDNSHSNGPLAVYNPSMLGNSRPPISDGPSVCPPLSTLLFWPPQEHSQHNMPLLTQHCPQPLVYSNPNHHDPWSEPKPHGLSPRSLLLQPTKLLGNHCCAVCHDYASGYHYNVWCCEGCKAFFKRSIQGHNDYICPATNQCTIDKNRRKSCKSCRLHKCYKVGMMKCGMKPKHCGYRRARCRRVPQGLGAPGGLVGVSARAQRHLEGGYLPQLEVHHSSLTPYQLISCIMNAEPPEVYLMEDLKRPFNEASMMMSLTKLANKELVLMISWAKKIPGFVELSLMDQVHLLNSCWMEVLMLGLMWRSIDHPEKLIFSADLMINREEGNCVEGLMIIFDMLLAATTRFRELNLQREEYVCLKAMILLNSNMCSTSPEKAEDLESRGKLQRLLDSVTDALMWAISKPGLSFQQQSARLGHLLLVLSHIRNISDKGMKHLSSMKKKNVVQVYDLLLEMLDANTTHSSHMSAPHDPSNHDPTMPPAAQSPSQSPEGSQTLASNDTVYPAEGRCVHH